MLLATVMAPPPSTLPPCQVSSCHKRTEAHSTLQRTQHAGQVKKVKHRQFKDISRVCNETHSISLSFPFINLFCLLISHCLLERIHDLLPVAMMKQMWNFYFPGLCRLQLSSLLNKSAHKTAQFRPFDIFISVIVRRRKKKGLM